MSPELPKNRLACIELITQAFADCARPGLEELVSHGGLDGPYVLQNWGGLTREDVLELPFFSHYIAEDLSYMSSAGLRYFLPAVLILFLRHPERIEPGGVDWMVSRLQGLVPCLRGAAYYRQVRLDRQQREAIHEWCGVIMTLLRKFDPSSWEPDLMKRLRAIRRASRTVPTDEDYEDVWREGRQ